MARIRGNERKKILALVGVALVVALVSYGALSSGNLDRFENALWDRRLRFVAERSVADPRIKIITIDQSSLDFFAREERIFWPWPRALYEPVINFLAKAGARAVAFDILYTEPSSYGVEDDAQFGAALRSGSPSVVAAALRASTISTTAEDSWQIIANNSRARSSTLRTVFADDLARETYGSAVVPVPAIAQAVTEIGNVSSSPDFDGIFRHTTPGATVHGVPVLSLPFALFDVANLAQVSVDRTKALLRFDGRLAVRFAGGAHTYNTRPIAAIIQSYVKIEAGETPLIALDDYKDAIVLVGMDAPGLLDLRPTPLAKVFPGVEFNASVLDNLMHSTFFIRSSAWQGMAISVLLCVILAAAALFLHRMRSQLVGIVGTFGIFTIVSFCLASQGVWTPMAVPILAGILTTIFCFTFLFRLEGRQHRFLRHAFRHYVSGDVIDQIIENPSSLAIGGEKRELTIFFSDIEGFTKISEKLDVAALVTLLNSFFTEMSGIIMAHGGTVDKYVGDAIVAFWNAPVERPDHAIQGVLAAVECQRRLAELRAEYQQRFDVTVRFRVGMHTGVVNVGNFGSSERFNYTMIGDPANLASRLEGVNKYFGTFILVSEATQCAVGAAIPMRRVAEVQVVGKKQSTIVFEPIEGGVGKSLEEFEHGRKLFEATRLEEALKVFEGLPEDPVALRYVQKIKEHLGEGVKQAGEFSPVFILTEK